MFKLALVQMQVTGGDKPGNVARALDRIERAADQGAAVIVLPEAMSLGWLHPGARALADTIPGGETCSALCEAARRHKVFVCTGLLERAGAQIFNAALLIDPDGQIRLHHRKINELEIAHDLYALGDRLQVAETPWGRFGLMICADAFAHQQVISRALGYMGAQIILSPCAWAVPADHDNVAQPYGQLWMDNYSPVARAFGLWIAGVSNVGWLTEGAWRGRKCIGCSLVVAPDGRAALQGPYGVDAETILFVEQVKLLPPAARGDGWAGRWSRARAAIT